jgi:hypothetical protein
MSNNQNPLSRLYHKLCETRWFYTFTASCTATIVGISLTFGINGCRESHRVKQEAQESIMQAVKNLHDRADLVDHLLEQTKLQDSLYLTVLAYKRNHVEIPDSLADACAGAMISDHETLADTSFEKIFRESYQLWQELDHDDLTNKISKGYQLVNHIENFCQSSRLVLLQKLDETDFKESLWSGDPHLVTDILAQNRRLYFFMGMRYENTKSFLNEAKYLRKIITKIDSICLAIGYGKYEERKAVSFTENAIKDDSTAIVQH